MIKDKPIVIIGASGFGKEVAWLAHRLHRKIKGFLDDDEHIQGTFFSKKPVLGKIADWMNHSECEFVVAIAAPRIRKKIVNIILTNGCNQFATLIDPAVSIDQENARVGKGSVICAGSVCTLDVEIGEHCIINKLCSIGHDVKVDDFVTLSPLVMLGGNSHIQTGVEIGASSCIRQQLTVNYGAMLGMGSVLTKNAPQNTLLVGNPAMPIRILTPF